MQIINNINFYMCYKLINIFILLSVFYLPLVKTQCQVMLYADQNCQNSIIAINIINKLEQKFRDIKFTKQVQRSIKEDIFSREDNEGIVYPRIQIRKNQKVVRYQNQLTFVQLQYWINIYCMSRIPQCASWMAQPIFPIHVYQAQQSQSGYKEYENFLQFVSRNQPIRICIDSSMPIDRSKSKQQSSQAYSAVKNTILSLMHELPVFLKLNHNIRNYLLINPGTTAVLYVYNQKIPFQMKMKDRLLQIIQFIRKKDTKISYQLSQASKNSLIFVCDTLNSKMVKRLLQFLDIDLTRIQISGSIIGFRFRQNPDLQMKFLQGIQYKINEDTVLDNKFVYWLEQLVQSAKNEGIRNRLLKGNDQRYQTCRSNQIVHYYQYNKIQDVLTNIKLLKIISQLTNFEEEDQLQFYGKEIFARVLSLYNQTPLQQQYQTRTLLNQTIFQFDKIISHDEWSLYTQYQLTQKFQLMISYPMVYTIPGKNQFKLCREGHQPVRYPTIELIFSQMIKNKLIKLTESQENTPELNKDEEKYVNDQQF